mmetsp:Transcript_157996/g.484218  ORF Transcript_157996/g.484218 Transcript_157996/m.484218 type:complete len:312 (+) Transcript_157996:37-972(+)
MGPPRGRWPWALLWLASAPFAHGLRRARAEPTVEEGRPPIKFVTMDTRDPRREIPVLGVKGVTMENAGVGRYWYADRAKLDYYSEWLSNTSLDEDLLVVLVDTDVVYGGCGLDWMAQQFQRYTELSGKKVVGGAELGIWPDSDTATNLRYRRLDARVNSTLSAFGLPSTAYSRHAWCPMWNGAPCGDPKTLRQMNSGFLMGRVRDLRPVVAGARAVESTLIAMRRDPEEQRIWSTYYLVNDDKMTLDYTGSLIIAMYGLTPWEILEASSAGIRNRVTGKKACLTHWNGQSRGFTGMFLEHLPFNDTSLKRW